MLLVGIDPGFANLGYAKVRHAFGKMTLTEMGVIRTQKSGRKIPASVDNQRRAGKLYQQLRVALEGADVICVEAMSFMRNASAAAKVSLAWGLLVACAEEQRLPIVQVSPKDLKLSVAGTAGASKERVAHALRMLYPSMDGMLHGIPKSRQEHPIDALAAIVASLDSEVVRMGVRSESA